MAKRALDRFARPTFHDKRLAFGEAPDWYIGCEGRSRVPAFEAEQIVGDLHDPRSDRLALAGLHRSPKQTRYIGLWRGVALDHAASISASVIGLESSIISFGGVRPGRAVP